MPSLYGAISTPEYNDSEDEQAEEYNIIRVTSEGSDWLPQVLSLLYRDSKIAYLATVSSVWLVTSFLPPA